MSANQARFRVATMARVLGVSTSGYYAWRQRPPSARAQADADLTARVRAIHADSRGTYGAPRIHAELTEAGVAVGRKRVARVMRAAGIAGVSRRRGPRTTRRDVQARPAPDRVERHFEADAPNRLWVADITYIPTLVGFLYLAIVLRRVQPAGRGLVDGDAPAHRAGSRGTGDGRGATPARSGRASLRPGLPVHVAGLRWPLPGNGAWRYRWVRWGIASTTQWPRASSRRSSASCWPARPFPTHAEARAAIFEFIEGWYNTRRRHSALGYASPLEFERLHAAVPVDGARPVEALQAPTSQVEIGLPVTTDTVTGFAAGA